MDYEDILSNKESSTLLQLIKFKMSYWNFRNQLSVPLHQDRQNCTNTQISTNDLVGSGIHGRNYHNFSKTSSKLKPRIG